MSDFPETPTVSSSGPLPDYSGLVTFLLKPFVEVESHLKVNSEFSSTRARIWVRVAFDGEDSTRLLGRGGRNIQAVRRVLEGVAEASGHTAYLDVYGNGQPPVEKKVHPQPRPR
ncbi:MAG: KH domain-containing protein [Alkalinema sp. RU_4_3]|nr:KH domain-containing protein [Alkalinema sp. RU_4_3]